MSLVDHAERELLKLTEGRPLDFPEQQVLDLVRTFADQGHSGSSAMWTLGAFERLARFQPLSALTDEPDEWQLVTEDDGDGKPTWQSRRHAAAFSRDGGKTYYSIDEPGRPLHDSEPKAQVA